MTSQCPNTLVIEELLAMGLFEYLARKNKVGVMMEEKEAYNNVRRTTVLEKLTKSLTSTSEGAPKMQPRRLTDESKGTEKQKSKLKNVISKS